MIIDDLDNQHPRNSELLPWEEETGFTPIKELRVERDEKDPYCKLHGPECFMNQPLEKDPNGIPLKQPGAKADAGKRPVMRGVLHYFPRALTAVAELSEIGARKYSWKGWEKVPDGVIRYGDAMCRHELRIEDDFTRRDPDTGVLEACAVAWNALARLELILRNNKE